MIKLYHVLARHTGALLVQLAEGARDIVVGEYVAGREHFAADEGVEMIAAVPEAPFSAEVGGEGDGGGVFSVEVCGETRIGVSGFLF